MAQLKGELLDPLVGESRAVLLDWDAPAATLHVRGPGISHQVPGASIRVATGGEGGQALLLAWPDGERSLTMRITERETVQALAGLISSSLARELENALAASLGTRRHERLWLILAGLVALLCAAALVAFRH